MTPVKPAAIAVFGEVVVNQHGSAPVVGGAAFGVARHLAGFGAAPLIVTRIGQDPPGTHVLRECERLGLPLSGLQRDTVLPQDRAYDNIDPAMAAAAVSQHRPGAIYFGTLPPRGCASRIALQRILQDVSALRFLDLTASHGQATERRVYESLAAADIARVDQAGLQELFNWYSPSPLPASDPDSVGLYEACNALVRDFQLQQLLVQLDVRSAISFNGDDAAARHEPWGEVECGDVPRADAAFSAVCLLGQALCWPLSLTLERAGEFAGAVVSCADTSLKKVNLHEWYRTRWEII